MFTFCKNLIAHSKQKKLIDNKQFTYPHVELYSWRPSDGTINFGDHLARIIVLKLLAGKGYLLEEETPRNSKLFSIGSVLHFADTGSVIWGSGINGKVDVREHKFESLDVRAVRGPLTRNFLRERNIPVPEVSGDPALLLPDLFPGRFVKTAKEKYVVVPNMHDMTLVKKLGIKNVISPLSSWNRCVDDILRGEFVIATSLHGIIVAEAYGIPARYLRLSETENLFKYNDYALGTGRDGIHPASSIEEALEMGGLPPPVFNAKLLIDAFPIDLWNASV